MAATAGDYAANKEGTQKVEIAVALIYLGYFWKTLDIPLINCEVSLALSWSASCVITSSEKRLVTAVQGDTPVACYDSPTNAITLSAENDDNLLEQLKAGFKRTIKWNKYMSEMSNQTKNNDLNYLIDPTFTNVNRIFVLSFEKKLIELLSQNIMYQKWK